MKPICPWCKDIGLYESDKYDNEQKEMFFIAKCLNCKLVNKQYAWPCKAKIVLERVYG